MFSERHDSTPPGGPVSLRRLYGYAVPYGRALAIIALAMLAETAVTLLIPWIGGKFAGSVMSDARAGQTALLAFMALLAAQSALRFASSYLSFKTSERITADLRIRLFDHLQALPLNYFHQRRHGDVLAMMINDVGHVSGFVTGTLISVVPMVLVLIGSLI